jgi:hypothetical protein
VRLEAAGRVRSETRRHDARRRKLTGSCTCHAIGRSIF